MLIAVVRSNLYGIIVIVHNIYAADLGNGRGNWHGFHKAQRRTDTHFHSPRALVASCDSAIRWPAARASA